MTLRQTAAAMHRVATAIESAKFRDADGHQAPLMEDDVAVGGALILRYIRDLVTCSNRDVFDRPTLLVILESISNDDEIFPFGTGRLIWDSEESDEE